MTAFPPVTLTLAPDFAYRVYHLALASAARASLTNARRSITVRSADYCARVDRMACGAQDAESDRTESIRESERYTWELVDSTHAAIEAAYPRAFTGDWGKSLRDAADNARLLSELATTTPHGDAADALYADAISRIRDELESATSRLHL